MADARARRASSWSPASAIPSDAKHRVARRRRNLRGMPPGSQSGWWSMTSATFLPYAAWRSAHADVRRGGVRRLRGPFITQGPHHRALSSAPVAEASVERSVTRRPFSAGRPPCTVLRIGGRRLGPGERGSSRARHLRGPSTNCRPCTSAPTRASSDIDPATWNLDNGGPLGVRQRVGPRDQGRSWPVSFAGLPVRSRPAGSAFLCANRVDGHRRTACHALGSATAMGRWVGGPSGADITIFSAAPGQGHHHRLRGGLRPRPEDDGLAERLRLVPPTHGYHQSRASSPGEHEGGWYYEHAGAPALQLPLSTDIQWRPGAQAPRLRAPRRVGWRAASRSPRYYRELLGDRGSHRAAGPPPPLDRCTAHQPLRGATSGAGAAARLTTYRRAARGWGWACQCALLPRLPTAVLLATCSGCPQDARPRPAEKTTTGARSRSPCTRSLTDADTCTGSSTTLQARPCHEGRPS
jgi:hypothetical protein